MTRLSCVNRWESEQSGTLIAEGRCVAVLVKKKRGKQALGRAQKFWAYGESCEEKWGPNDETQAGAPQAETPALRTDLGVIATHSVDLGGPQVPEGIYNRHQTLSTSGP